MLFDIRPSTGWYGWNVGSVAQAGIVLQWCCGYTYLQHFNALGSTLMTTDQTGAVQRQQINGPWGQGWEYYGSWYTVRYAGMDFPKLQGNDVASFRDYNPTLGRWLMPDPAGRAAANPANPQSWNMYAYVGDNPTSVTDPSGLSWVWAGNCAYDNLTVTDRFSVSSTGDKTATPRGTWTYNDGAIIMCNGIADGDLPMPAVVPDTTGLYRINVQVKVAAESRAVCAARLADKYSIAGVAGTIGKSGLLANVFNGFAGNAVSGLVLAVSGRGSPLRSATSLTNLRFQGTAAAINAVTKPEPIIQLGLSGEQVGGELLGEGLGGIISAVKLGYDATSFAAAYFLRCK